MDEDRYRMVETLVPYTLSFAIPLLYPVIRVGTECQVTLPLYCNKITDKCVQIRLLQKASSLKLSKTFPQNALWGTLSLVTKYTDNMPVFRKSLHTRSHFRGIIGFSIWQLIMVNSYTVKTNASWKEVLLNYCEVMLCAAVTKPFKVAHTRFAIQDVNNKTYQNLRHFFAAVPVRSMWQGFSLTLLREHLLFLASWNLGPLCVFTTCFLYPIFISETRLEAMSSDKNMLPYRYTSFTATRKIVYEEGLGAIFKGLRNFAAFVRTKQYAFFIISTTLVAGVSYSIEEERKANKLGKEK